MGMGAPEVIPVFFIIIINSFGARACVSGSACACGAGSERGNVLALAGFISE
jgi:hypothetical protein